MGLSLCQSVWLQLAAPRHVPTTEASVGVTHIQTLCTKCGGGTAPTKKIEVLLPDAGQAKMRVATTSL